MQTLDIESVDQHFTNVTRDPAALWVTYEVNDKHGNTTGTITFPEADEMRIFVDNFPGAKKYFSSNLPMRSLEQLQADIDRTGLTLIPKSA